MSRRALPEELRALRTIALYTMGEKVESSELVDHPAVNMIRGTELYRKGDYHNAYQIFRRVYAQNPKMIEAKINMAFALVRLGKDDEAYKIFTQLPEDRVNEYVLNELGCIVARKGDNERAKEYFEQALKKNPNFALAKLNMVALLLNEGKIEEAKKMLESMPPEQMGEHGERLLAYIDYFTGDYEDALEHITKYVKTHENDHVAWLLKAECEGILGKTIDAENSAKKSYELKRSAHARAAIAAFKLENGEVGKAVGIAEEVAAKNPHNHRALKVLALGYYQLGNYGKSYEYATRALDLKEDLQLRMVRGESARRLGKYGTAIADAETVLYAKPDYRKAKILKALALAGMGDYDSAISVLDEAKTEEDFLLYTAYAEVYDKKGDKRKCAESLEKAIEYQKSVEHLRKLCLLLYELGENEKLERYLKELTDVKSKDAYVWYIYGEVYLRKDRDTAEKYYKMAIDIDPKFVDAYVRLLTIAAMKKDAEGIKSNLEKIKSLSTSLAVWKDVFKALFENELYNEILSTMDVAVETSKDESLRIFAIKAHIELKNYEEALEVAKDLSAKLPENMEAKLYLGIAYYYNKKYQQAMKTLESIEEPFKMEARYYIARVYFETGRAAEALEISDEYPEEEKFIILKMEILFSIKSYDALMSYIDDKIALLHGKNLTNALLYRMKVYFAIDDAEHGFETGREILERVPDAYDVILLMAQEYIKRERFEEALEYARSAVELKEEEEAIYAYALTLYRLGRLDEAREQAEKLGDENKNHAVLKARILLDLKDYEAALKIAKSLVERERDDEEILLLTASIYFAMEKYNEAAKYYERVFLKDLGNMDVLEHLPIAYARLKDYEKAEKMFERAMERYGDKFSEMPDYIAEYAAVEIELKKFGDARNILESSKNITPKIHLLLGKVYYLIGNYSEALKHLNSVGDEVGGERLYYLVLTYIGLERYNDALNILNSLSEEHGDMLYYHGLALYHMAKYDEALEKFRAFRKENGQKDELDYYEGMCLFHLGKYEECIPHLEKAETVNEESFKYEAIALFKLGNHEKAMALFKVCEKKELMSGDMWIMYGDSAEAVGGDPLPYYERAWKEGRTEPTLALKIVKKYFERGEYEKAKPYISSLPKDDVAAVVLGARVLMNLEDYTSALAFLEGVEGKEVQLMRGILLARTNRIEEAVKVLEVVADLPEASYNLVKLLIELERYADAEHYIAVGEKHGALDYEKMLIYFHTERWKEALDIAEDFIKRGEKVQEATYIAGVSLYNLEDYDGAISYLEQSEGIGEDVDYYLGMSHYKKENWEEAVKYLKNSDKAVFEYGMALYNLGRFEEALEAFVRSGKDEAKKYAGLAAYRAGKYDIAVEYLEGFEEYRNELAESYFALERYEDVVRVNPDNPRMLGMAHYHLKDYEKALENLKNVENKGPEDYYYMAICSVNLNNFADARKYVENAKASGYEGDLSEIEGLIAYHEGKYEVSAKLLEKSETPELRSKYGISLYHLGKYREAISVLAQLEDDESRKYYALSLKMTNNRDNIKKALQIFEELHDNKNAAECHLKLGEYEDVVRLLKGYEDEESRRMLFESYLKLGLHDEAIELYKKFKETNRAYFAQEMCEILIEKGRYDEAESIMNEHFVDDYRWHMIRARIAVHRKDYSTAVESLTHARKINPHDAEISRLLAPLLLNMGKEKDALKEAKRAVDEFPNDAVCWYNLGVAYNKLGKTKNAVEALKKSISLDHELLEAWHLLGLIHLHEGKYEEAYDALSHVKDRIEDRDVLFSLATTAYELEKYEEALEFIDSALAINRDAMALYYRALILVELEREEEAIESLKEAIKLNPGFIEARKLMGTIMGGE